MKYLLILLSTAALSQEPLDVTQAGAYPAFPAYLDHSCGGVALETTEAGLSVMVRATTTCSTGGRGSKPKHYLACWRVIFSDRYTVASREQVVYAASTTPARECPAP